MDIEEKVASHYTRPGLEADILTALKESGKDVDRLVPSDLSGVDEFHLGWHPATIAFAKALDFPRDAQVIDLGAGLGGPARHFAESYGVRVTGVDLTEDYVMAANSLTRRCDLSETVRFQRASALALPFADESFGGAYTIHVAMNISDKAALFQEARRVVRPGARFGIYDVMRAGDGAIPFPMPWAATAETSFVETAATYRQVLEAAGFAIEAETDRSALVRDVARQMREKAEKEGPPRLGLQTLMGAATGERVGNLMKSLEAGLVAPVEIIARAR